MKLILVVVAILGLTNALPQRSLRDELKDFVNLLPLDDMKALAKEAHARGDFDRIIAYVRSDEFAAAVERVRQSEQLQRLVSYLEGQGVDVEALKEWALAIIGLLPLDAEVSGAAIETRAFSDFWTEFKALIPTEEIKALWIEKRENSEVIQAIVAKIHSDEARELVHNLVHTETVQAVWQRIKDAGIDIDHVIQWIRDHTGW